jgi:hypothetical protein
MASEFAGAGLPMSAEGMTNGCDLLGVKAAEIWAVLTVETTGSGFLPDRRPQILFERHIFHRETDGAFDATTPEVSNATPGGYGTLGAHQYDRLAQAITLNRQAALHSASWGIGQVMGFNADNAGFPDVETMVQAMVKSEDAQVGGMFEFLLANHLDGPLRSHDWTSFARGYNGPGFAKNQYGVRLSAAFQKFATGLLPDLTVRAAQIYLKYSGFDPGPVDGMLGRMTRSAAMQFQQTKGLARTGELDDATLARLRELASIQ